jgi:hypothetical protein
METSFLAFAKRRATPLKLRVISPGTKRLTKKLVAVLSEAVPGKRFFVNRLVPGEITLNFKGVARLFAKARNDVSIKFKVDADPLSPINLGFCPDEIRKQFGDSFGNEGESSYK